MVIIHRANAKDAHPRELLANTIHQRPTRAAEIVSHLLPRLDSFRLSKRLPVVLATQVRQVRVEDCEVGGEHGRGDLATVAAVAEEAADEAGLLGWEGELHGAAEAGRRRRVVLRPAVGGAAGKRKVGLGFIELGGHGGVFLDNGFVGHCGFDIWRLDVATHGE
ncbi:hypothetical protein V495_08678 [Pseudogymnoascus sp. VKM F-4514 (FW-929)]|nr:hypothetical protein V495_08678 [Pseudogymnoascus sp. VKM F-4514 (FW-929)]KFY56640.1 hypothetical protein V497_06111 [Pseudogymnoascus sp. VKM F-4516 (FW-969)]